jgi:signal peptidase
MQGNSVNLKKVLKKISTIITWAVFVVLIFVAIILAYYFISLRIYAAKGDDYAPKFSIYTIVSPSMTPTINVYDVIVNTKVKSPTEIKVGDIITFKSTSSLSYGMTVTHRVQDVQIVNGEYQYLTKGDFNISADGAPAKYSNVIGKVLFKIPQLGRIQFFVASKFGWLLVVVIPALLVIMNDIKKLVRLSKVRKDAEIKNTILTQNDDKIELPMNNASNTNVSNVQAPISSQSTINTQVEQTNNNINNDNINNNMGGF